MSVLGDFLGFLGKRHVWYSVVAVVLLGLGWVNVADAKEVVLSIVAAFKDWNPLGGAP